MKLISFFALLVLSVNLYGDFPMQLPIKPMVYAFPHLEVSGLYPVPFARQIFADPYPSGGLQFVTLGADGMLGKRLLPKSQYFGGGVQKLIFTDNNSKMYLCEKRAITLVELDKFKPVIAYPQKIEHVSFGYHDFMLLDSLKQIMLVYEDYYGWATPGHVGGGEVQWCKFTIKDLKDSKNLNQLELKNDDQIAPKVFCDDCIIYRENEDARWVAIKYSLEPAEHPILKILNDKMPLFILDPEKKLLVFEKNKTAIICGILKTRYANVLNIISWEKSPDFAPIIFQGEENSSANYDLFQASPSKTWVFVCMEDSKKPSANNYLIHVSQNAPGGYLPPFKLPIQGTPQAVSWTTEPEGLVIAMSQRLIWWDLSQFRVEDFISGK
jgi:hypothetical protein